MLKKVPIVLLFIAFSAPAIVINEETFNNNGGNISNVAGTIESANQGLLKDSYRRAWLAVGKLKDCTATWIGDKDSWSYFLTAARCVPVTGEITPFTGEYTSWDDVVSAAGQGFAYVPREYNERELRKRLGADIALLKLPTKQILRDPSGSPLEPPILDDLPAQVGKPIVLIGYGGWGVGESLEPELPGPVPLQLAPTDSVFHYHYPKTGSSRLYARSVLDRTVLAGKMVRANYVPNGKSPRWARLADGDSGAPIWQFRGRSSVITAVGTTYDNQYSNGVAVSNWSDWIKSIYPEARFLSDMKPRGCIVSRRTGARYCLEAGKRSGYSLPAWINGHEVDVQADSGTSVMLSDWDNLSYNRLAQFVGTVENAKLRAVKAYNGETLDFSRPHSMRVLISTKPLGCIVSLTSADKYCLPAGERSGGSLPAWIQGHDVFVEADTGTAVTLSDTKNLANNRVAVFKGAVDNETLKKVQAYNGEYLDFSKPRSMRVDQW